MDTIDNLARGYSQKQGVSYQQAVVHVLQHHPELAKKYAAGPPAEESKEQKSRGRLLIEYLSSLRKQQMALQNTKAGYERIISDYDTESKSLQKIISALEGSPMFGDQRRLKDAQEKLISLSSQVAEAKLSLPGIEADIEKTQAEISKAEKDLGKLLPKSTQAVLKRADAALDSSRTTLKQYEQNFNIIN